MNFNKLLGESWTKLLKDYLDTGDLEYIARCINDDRAKYTIIPEKGSPYFIPS